MRLLLPIVAITLVACGGSTTAARNSSRTQARPVATCADPQVALRFDWPASLRARVTGHDVTESANTDGSSPMRGESWADLSLEASREGSGIQLAFATQGRTRPRSQGFAPDVGGARPTVHLDARGRVTSVEGARAMDAVVRQAWSSGEIDADTAEQLLHNTTDERQLNTAAAHWDWILSAWNGLTLQCGVAVTLTAHVPALSFGSADVETQTELTYRGREPCTRVGARTCVVLEARQRDIGGSAHRAITQSGTGRGEATAEGAWFVRTVRILVEPETLVPHRVTFEEVWEIEWRHAGGATTRHIRDLQTYRFDYEAPLPPPGTRWAVVREGGTTRPDTPACRRVEACCAALGPNLMAQLICAGIPREGNADCTDEDLLAVRGIGSTLEGGAPPACQ